jgi:starch synthase
MRWMMNQASLYMASDKGDETTISKAVKSEITHAFAEYRCFPFFPDADIIGQVRMGEPLNSFIPRFTQLKTMIMEQISEGDETIKTRMMKNAHLSSRLVKAISFIHQALSDLGHIDLPSRRMVLIKEKPACPGLYSVSETSAVISHVGQGPLWTEIPTIYLGLNIFEALSYEQKRGEAALYRASLSLLLVEERAIETGYSHTEQLSPASARELKSLIREIIRISKLVEVEYPEIPEPKKARRFTERTRRSMLRLLDARIPNDDMKFDYEKNLQALRSLERFARRYKMGDDIHSLREVVRLLVAASGHDNHEIRNRANFILERIFSVKEFDAPVASQFINLHRGDPYRFQFDLPKEKNGYFLRLYKNSPYHAFTLGKDIDFLGMDMWFDDKTGFYTTDYTFDTLGHFDYLVFRKKPKKNEWLSQKGCSGRINVIPDVHGELILEIFPDIHGHTRAYWKDKNGHTGLVYNEHGEVIRLGRFSDIAAHLEDLKKRYQITALYLLGVQKRGYNREDWAPQATSPSPFSPMSLTEIEPSLGGKQELIKLIDKAHSLGVKIILDIIPHLNRKSTSVPEEYVVKCYDSDGQLVSRAATDGRYGSWNDGKLLNFRKFEIWEWITESILTLIDNYDIDGIRFDSAHAVPIMMKKNNYPFYYGTRRAQEEMVEGSIILNDREDEHFITTGYYDSSCRDVIAVPFHYYIMLRIEKKLREKNKSFFVNIAECFWGRERYLARTGIIPYNSALFKICENIIHGKTDVREIYHLYDSYFVTALPPGTELLGILGNHDERRALNTFGIRGLRAAIGLTCFLNSMIMDYEGSAEGEGWKVYLDNIFVNWNQFQYASYPGIEQFYHESYSLHRKNPEDAHLIWSNNNMVAAAMKFKGKEVWIGAFNFSENSQSIELQFDKPTLPIDCNAFYRVVDPIYSPVTKHYNYYTGRELRVARLHTIIPYTDRIKFLKLEIVENPSELFHEFFNDSFVRFCTLGEINHISSNFAFNEIAARIGNFEQFASFCTDYLLSHYWKDHRGLFQLGIKRAFYHISKKGIVPPKTLIEHVDAMCGHSDERIRSLGLYLRQGNSRGPLVFLSAEAEPFSKSGGLANVVYELPRELVELGEEVYVITPFYQQGEETLTKKMQNAVEKYSVSYTGKNVRFFIQNSEYEVGIHHGKVEGINFFLLDHHEFFDGLYWGLTAEEKLRRRIAFARASAELITSFNLKPLFTFTNDAFAGIFNGVVKEDPYYATNSNFQHTSFFHIVHNVGWQYFDSYYRYEKGFDHFHLFNLPEWQADNFCDPAHPDRINCMAAGIRFADRIITVSPSYAKQISVASDGLEQILHSVTGINNAIASDFYSRIRKRFEKSPFVESNYPGLIERIQSDPKLLKKIESRYPELMEGALYCETLKNSGRREILFRMRNKLLLQFQRGLEVDPDRILFSMIHRIAEQKGFQLLLEASEGIFKNLKYQGIIGGSVASGDRRAEELAQGLSLLQGYYPGSVSVNVGFQDVSIPLLSSDIFLMPSMYEPGGISQLEAFACGCFVVARATGGLRDTVKPIQIKNGSVEGNGVLFSDFTAHSLYDAMERCSVFFRQLNDSLLLKARTKVMRMVYFWNAAAQKYIEEIYAVKEIIRP